MPKKYLTKSDKAFKRVNPAYALKQAKNNKEVSWLNEYRQNVISTCPKRIAANFASYDFTNIIEKSDSKKESVFISGKANTGKTVLSAYLYVNMIHDLYIKRGTFSTLKFYFVRYSEFIEEMQKQINERNVVHTDLVKMYSQCDLLVLDDFGVRKITDYVYSLTYLIIDYRYTNMLPTIINSNYSLAELSSIFEDDRIIRRIDEDYLLIEKTTYKK